MALSIADEQFKLDCYGMALSSFDMVLDVIWLEYLGPILWDFTKQMITFMWDGHQVCWLATDATPPSPSILAADTDGMADLLLRFNELFAEPTGLPSQRVCSHQIRLLPDMTPVAVHPYRYKHVQKAELE
jgi:hypothetical protein